LQLDRRCWPSWASIAGRGGASFARNSHSCGPRLTERWHHRLHSWLRSAPCCDSAVSLVSPSLGHPAPAALVLVSGRPFGSARARFCGNNLSTSGAPAFIRSGEECPAATEDLSFERNHPRSSRRRPDSYWRLWAGGTPRPGKAIPEA
jgi:hypothetical protein